MEGTRKVGPRSVPLRNTARGDDEHLSKLSIEKNPSHGWEGYEQGYKADLDTDLGRMGEMDLLI